MPDMSVLSSYHPDSMTSSELYDDVITNRTSVDAYDSHVGPVESLVEALTLGTISLVSVVGNAALWLVILDNKGLRIESNLLLLCLSLADLLVSTVSMPVTVVTITSSRWIFSELTCVAMGYLNMITFTASVQSLAVISWNRYVKICQPHRYNQVFTYLKTGCVCLGVWLVSGLLSLPPLLGWAAYSYLPTASLCFCNWALSFTYALFMIFACFCVPCIIMTFCNVNILRAFLHSRRAIQAHKDKDKDRVYNHSEDKNTDQYTKATLLSVKPSLEGSDIKSDADLQNNSLEIFTKNNSNRKNAEYVDPRSEKEDNPVFDIELSDMGKSKFHTSFNFLLKRFRYFKSKKVETDSLRIKSPNYQCNIEYDENVVGNGITTDKTEFPVDNAHSYIVEATKNKYGSRMVGYGTNKNEILRKFDTNNSCTLHSPQQLETCLTSCLGVVVCGESAQRKIGTHKTNNENSVLETRFFESAKNDKLSFVNTNVGHTSQLNAKESLNTHITSGKLSSSADIISYTQSSPPPRKLVKIQPQTLKVNIERRRREEFQVAASLVVVIILFIVCWFPYCISMFVSVFTPSRSSRGLDVTSLFLGYFNSCVNPIVYGLMNKKFQTAYIKLFTACVRPVCKRNRLDLGKNYLTRSNQTVTTISTSTCTLDTT
ncbi:tyramine receptor 1-like [Physella acuta]|uniref:tyramine receptor 1-like n=1 Tax=Physella acuta TaxID=109671 RepID=UPI0027DB9459|nr:tyramine receptor 1-like [Physella acuta]